MSPSPGGHGGTWPAEPPGLKPPALADRCRSVSRVREAHEFELIERISPEALASHPAWTHFEVEVDRARVLAWGVPAPALDDQVRQFEHCGLVPLCPVIEIGGLARIPDVMLAARFTAPGGPVFDGYLLDPHAFGLFHETEEYSFNRSLPGFSAREARRLAATLGCEVGDLFPLVWQLDPRATKDGELTAAGSVAIFW